MKEAISFSPSPSVTSWRTCASYIHNFRFCDSRGACSWRGVGGMLLAADTVKEPLNLKLMCHLFNILCQYTSSLRTEFSYLSISPDSYEEGLLSPRGRKAYIWYVDYLLGHLLLLPCLLQMESKAIMARQRHDNKESLREEGMNHAKASHLNLRSPRGEEESSRLKW